MKKAFNELEQKDFEYIASIYEADFSHKEKIELLQIKYPVTGRCLRGWFKKLGLTNAGRDLPDQLKKVAGRSIPEGTDIVLVTACQNKTQINRGILDNLKAYKKFLEKEFDKSVEIAIIPTKYRNPTSLSETAQERDKKEQWWVPEVSEYLYCDRTKFYDTTIACDIHVRPTVMNPLRGYEPIAEDGNLVIGSPRVAQKMLPRFKDESLAMMISSGYISRKNYSDSSVGAKGEVHHTYSACMLELGEDGKCLPPRSIKFDGDGTFTDIVFRGKEEKIDVVNKSKGLVWGDIHYANVDNGFLDATYKFIEKVNPKIHILHDLLDGESINRHDRKDMFIQKMKIKEGRSDIHRETEEAVEFADNLSSDTGAEVAVVQSNHDDWIDYHINDASWKKDLHNSEAYLKLAMIQQTVDLRDHGNIFGYLVNKTDNSKVRYVKGSDSLRISGYQVGFHGHIGKSGARGSMNTFKKLRTKTIVGHGHSPQTKDGATMVGTTSRLWQWYNSDGLSEWAFGHCLIHETGKSQLLVFNDNYKVSTLI